MLPEIHKKILEGFLNPLVPNLSENAKLNAINVKLAQMVSYNRIKIKQYSHSKPSNLNYYSITLAASGIGKDNTLNLLNNHIFADVNARITNEEENYIKLIKQQIHKESETLKTEKEKIRYIKEQEGRIRQLKPVNSTGTPEGLFQDLLSYEKAQFGSLIVNVNELGLFLKSNNEANDGFMKSLTEAFDGNLEHKSLKTENEYINIRNTSLNAIMYSDPAILKTGKNNKKILELFQNGIARRSFLSYQDLTEIKNVDPLSEEKAFCVANELNNYFNSVFLNLKEKRHMVLDFTSKAKKTFNNYRQDKINEYNKVFKKQENILNAELLGRFWKVLKLAGILAAVENNKTLKVEVKHILQAGYIADKMVKDFKNFINGSSDDDIEILIKYLTEKRSTTELRKFANSKFNVNNNNFKKWFESIQEGINERLDTSEYLDISKKNRSKVYQVKANKQIKKDIKIKELDFDYNK